MNKTTTVRKRRFFVAGALVGLLVGSIVQMDASIRRFLPNISSDSYLYFQNDLTGTSSSSHPEEGGAAATSQRLLVDRALRAQQEEDEEAELQCPLPLKYYHDRILLNDDTSTKKESAHDDDKKKEERKLSQHQHQHLIPRVIHVTMKSRCLPQDMYPYLERWQDKLPNFSIVFHDDDDVDALLGEDWPDFPQLHEVLPCVQFKGAMKVDIWRLLVLYRYGGIYTDIDNWPLDKFKEDLFDEPDLSALFLSDAWLRPSQWFMAMEPRHPIAFFAMQQILSNVYNLDDIARPRLVFVTGPGPFNDGFARFFHNQRYLNDAKGLYLTYRNKKVRKIGEKNAAGYMTGKPNWKERVPYNSTFSMTRQERVEHESGVVHWKTVVENRLAKVDSGSCRDYLVQLETTTTTSPHGGSDLEAATSNNRGSDASEAATAVIVDLTLAYKQSFGLFNDVTNTVWEELRTKTKSQSWYANPVNPLENIDDAEWWNAHNMLPNFDCPHLEKVGGKQHEGTKFVCNPQRLVRDEEKQQQKDGCLIYSVGCAGDFKFEDAIFEMHKKGCEIHVFDPADWSRPNDVEVKKIHYHDWGFVSTYDQESKSVVWPRGRGGGFKTFPETLQLLGHQHRTIDIFKIDCEGCEWSSHKDWIGHGIRQILIEMHGVPSPRGTPKARWYQKPMDVSAKYWKDFSDNGYALYSRDPNGALGMELSFMKLHEDFWKD